jgi:hypothetical protein
MRRGRGIQSRLLAPVTRDSHGEPYALFCTFRICQPFSAVLQSPAYTYIFSQCFYGSISYRASVADGFQATLHCALTLTISVENLAKHAFDRAGNAFLSTWHLEGYTTHYSRW